MADLPLDLQKIIEAVGPWLVGSWTKEELKPHLPMIRGFLKNLPAEQKVVLAVALKEKAPQLADLIDEIVAEPAPAPGVAQPPPPEEQESETLTEEEEARIAVYTEQRSTEGMSYRGICQEVNATWNTDFGPLDLRDLVSRQRVLRYNQDRKMKIQVLGDQTQTLRRLLEEEKGNHQREVYAKSMDYRRDIQAEQEAHLKTKEAMAQKLLDYRDGLVLRWAGSLLAAAAVGLVLGRFLR